jgi:hypothetical protein
MESLMLGVCGGDEYHTRADDDDNEKILSFSLFSTSSSFSHGLTIYMCVCLSMQAGANVVFQRHYVKNSYFKHLLWL